MWTIIIIVVALIVFSFIRHVVRVNGHYKVVSKKGVTFHIGNYYECASVAKEHNTYFKAFGIDDHFKVIHWKI